MTKAGILFLSVLLVGCSLDTDPMTFAKTTAKSLNVRDAPSGKVIDSLPKNSIVGVVGVQEEWVQVVYGSEPTTKDVRHGWVSARYLQIASVTTDSSGRTSISGDQVTLFSLIAFGTVIAVIVISLARSARNRRSGHRTTASETAFETTSEIAVETASEPKKPYQTAKVRYVIDGDTVIVATSCWRKIRIRLDAIDCPEKGQDWGDIAKYGLIKLIGGRRIHFEEHCQDKYGRTVATIYVQNGDGAKWMNVNARMVTLGHAWVMRNFYQHLPKERQDELNRLETWARTNRVGLWNSENPVPPWEWR